VIATSVSIAGMLLCGWLCGLTEHAFAAVGWRDPGARAAWLAGAGTVATAAFITSTTVCLLTRPLAWLLMLPACLIAGRLAGRRACQALLRTHATGARADRGSPRPPRPPRG
jgi:hypothetical protein